MDQTLALNLTQIWDLPLNQMLTVRMIQKPKRKTKGKAKVVRKGKTFTASVSKTMRRPRQSKRPRLNVDDNDWRMWTMQNLKSSSAFKNKGNQGRRTVRYHDGDDDRSLENVLDFDDCTL